MTNFPASLDTFTNPSADDAMDASGLEHDVQHTNLNDAVAALQTRVGATDSVVTTTHDYRLKQVEKFASGRIGLGSAVSGGIVSGLGLTFTPATIALTVEAASDSGFALFASVVGVPTSDGFTFIIGPGTTDDSTYKLHYHIRG